MPRNGNMKPDSRIEGSRMKTEACIACSWFWVTVEMVKPIARFTVMNSAVPRQSRARLPSVATSNRKRATTRITATCTEPMAM
jgi:hypothetical protein